MNAAVNDDDGLAWLRALLDKWAACVSGNPYRALWYPSQNMLYRAGRGDPGMVAKWDAETLRIENALTLLGMENKRGLDIIKSAYIFDQGYAQIAKAHNVDWRTIKKWQLQAEQQTADYYLQLQN